VIQMFEFREASEPIYVMKYYPDENIVKALVIDDERRISAMKQILDDLSHLHAKRLTHRDLKPENFLIKLKSFQIVIIDFDLFKVVLDVTLLKTFCETLKYAASKMFLDFSDDHELKVDV
jgi:serine/threonine protein kinase